MINKVLTIAGSDSSGGAGIQADIKTITANGMYAMSVITAITAQNTIGVQAVNEISPEMVAEQLDSVFTDIFPDAVKIGMVSSDKIIEVIADKLIKYRAKNIVLDTVMVSTSGCKLISDNAINALKKYLIPLADLITPNIPEAEVLSGMKIKNREDMLLAAKKLAESYDGAVLLKGGHMVSDATDLLYAGGKAVWLVGKRIDNPNTHGTGCTLSSAISCGLAGGKDLVTSIKEAKEYLTGAIAAMMDIGNGQGPVNHMWKIESRK